MKLIPLNTKGGKRMEKNLTVDLGGKHSCVFLMNHGLTKNENSEGIRIGLLPGGSPPFGALRGATSCGG